MTGTFDPTTSSNTIWFDDDMEDCLTSHIEGIEDDIDALETGKANLVHTHPTYADIDHTHSNYASTTHTHSGYATTDHTHTGYATSTHSHSEYALATDVDALEIKVGDSTVASQISTAVATKADSNHTHTEYAAAEHTHSGYASTSHSHSEYANVDHTHTGYASSTHVHSYNDLEDKPTIPTTLPANGGNADTVDGKHASEFALVSDITALQSLVGDTSVSTQISTAVASKANTVHTHITADVTGLETVLNAKYEKPSTGITKTDLASDVQISLGKADTAVQSLSGYATESYVNAAVSGLIDSAPDALNTLNELAAALGDDANFATTVTTQLGGKVDKVDGKELSSNDYTDAEKTKLAGIADGANAYTLPTASSSTLGGVKTTSTVTSNSGYTACPIISGVPYYKDTNTTYSLSSFGVTATATELNYVDGVTSNIQTQLNGKAESSHGTHVSFTTTTPKAAGTAAVGSATTVSRSDHVHPEQTTVSGNAGSATKLATARTICTNLSSTSTASFNGTANITPGVTGTLPVANGGTGQTKAWTNGTVTSLNNTTVTSSQFAVFPYLNKAFIRLNILTTSSIAADGALFVALPSTIPTAHTALSCYNEIGYDIHCGVSSNAGKGVYIINCGTSSMPSGTRLYIAGWYSI